MRILVAVDPNPYSGLAVAEAAKLAKNTWANVTLLGVDTKSVQKGEKSAENLLPGGGMERHPLMEALRGYREDFLKYFKGEDSPYTGQAFDYEVIEMRKGIWEELRVCRAGKKDLRVRMRLGNPLKEILSESIEKESDLIVISCDKENKCAWERAGNVPQKVANEASCSVMVVKGKEKINQVVCCLDHAKVSQASLELISQMVTLHRATLDIIGLTEKESLKTEVEKKMDRILKYYAARHIKPWVKLVDEYSLEAFINQEARRGLIALWMGEKSVLGRIFPRSKVDKLVKAAQSSILILR
jgi:nucleotide-binding universal stress UspA family protein